MTIHHQSAKTRCPKNHSYDATNTRYYTDPKTGKTQRVCRQCARDRSRSHRLLSEYGITLEDFDRMFEKQDGLCAICREAPATDVDHDHETGVVRGLICNPHNLAIGLFRDRTDLLLAAVQYLEGAMCASTS